GIDDLEKVPHESCPMTIDIKQQDVPYCKPHRMSEPRRDACNKIIQELIAADIVQESNANGGAPTIVIPKRQGDFRLVVDYSKLNSLLKKKEYPMPVIDDFLNVLKGNRYNTVVDLSSGYYQLELHPDERAKTVFVTEDNKYEF